MCWLLLFPCAIIAFQDFKSREISWWSILLLFILMWFESAIQNYDKLQYSIINLIVFIIELLFVSCYFSIKSKRVVNILKGHLGLGDVLFFIVLVPFFNPISFLFFQIVGLVLVLLGSLIYGLFRSDWAFKIPLAGVFAIFLVIKVILQHFNILQNYVR
jgi:hypothetical protein